MSCAKVVYSKCMCKSVPRSGKPLRIYGKSFFKKKDRIADYVFRAKRMLGVCLYVTHIDTCQVQSGAPDAA